MAKRKRKKKKQRKLWWLVIPVLLLVVAAIGYVWYRSQRIETAKFIRYPAFGIDIPENYEIHGIDVSKYQSYIDWKSVKQMEVKDVKIGFAFMKATEGLGNVDKQFRRNWKKAGEAKMTRGAYHFFIASKSGKAQARNFISTVKLQPGDLPPVLDIEHLYGVKPEKMKQEIREWLRIVEDHYGVRPIIYTYVSFYSSYLAGEFDSYPLWVAHYLEKNKPRIKQPWIIWQHSEKGRVNGIAHAVDFNVFNGDSSDFKDLLIK
ncbi:glycoside hydrolase family 25 protein [Aridibaculum aurantiacum]|uniref:glycoside hydrolase family 25 protein n=1 Tax=Aridibaculum aurantiacum TaxID=2810307 RepID=UPI001A96C01E|nr:glycoside hydrolase family 25 protein [Aridibaculum aurantiacum]